MAGIAGAASGEILASVATLTGNIVVTAANEGGAQTLFALGAVTYDGVSPIEVRALFPLCFIPKNIEGRVLLRRADTHAIIGTLAKVIGLNTQDRVETLEVGTLVVPPAGTYGLEIAGWSSLGTFQVEGGTGGPGEHLVPGYATVTSVLTVPPLPPARRIIQIAPWHHLLLALTATNEIWALRGMDAFNSGDEARAPQEWQLLTLVIPETAVPLLLPPQLLQTM